VKYSSNWQHVNLVTHNTLHRITPILESEPCVWALFQVLEGCISFRSAVSQDAFQILWRHGRSLLEGRKGRCGGKRRPGGRNNHRARKEINL